MRIPGDHRIQSGEQPAPLVFLARMARRSSDGALVLYASVGLLGTALLLTREPHWWVLIPTFTALALFGLWGIVDRTMSEQLARSAVAAQRSSGPLLHGLALLRGVLAVAGVIAGIAAVLFPLSASLDNVVH